MVWFLGPLLLALPAQVFVLAEYRPGLKAWLENTNVGWLWLLASLPFLMGLVRSGISRIAFSFANPVEEDNLLALLRILNELVARKSERFFSTLEEVRKQPKDAAEIFRTITKPDVQIERLVEGIWQYFNFNRDRHEPIVRVVLAEMGNKHITKYRVSLPADMPPKARTEDLQRDDCGFSAAKASRRILIIEDVGKEGKATRKSKFVSTSEDTTGAGGSMICWPVVCERLGEVPYVLSIYAPRRGYFTPSEERVYAYVLDMFSRRILLEYGLEQLKGVR